MGQTVPSQHPAVVLRSHYTHLRALFVAALVAIVGLAGAVVLVASDDSSSGASSSEAVVAPQPSGDVRYDGGPEEGTRGIVSVPPSSTRFDGGPEEGTRGPGR